MALTFGGRYNYAHIDLKNEAFEIRRRGDPEDPLTGTHDFYRFNPMVGATYKLAPGLTVYGSYAEANRAPTAAELACADPDNPCLIESFLTADPPLKQVVSHTFELGLRGKLAPRAATQKLEWTAGCSAPRTPTTSSPSPRRSTAAATSPTPAIRCARASSSGVVYQDRAGCAYANYAFIDATFRDAPTSSPRPTIPTRTISTAYRRSRRRANCILVQPGRPTARRSAPPLQGRLRLLGDARRGRSAPTSSPPATSTSSATKATTARRSPATPRSTSARPTTSPRTCRSTA